MKVFVIYDSVYGNTESIAGAIANALGTETKVLKISEVDFSQVSSGDLIFIGGPTQGGRPTKAMQDFLGKIPEASLKGVNIAVFDTRLSSKVVGIFGYAAGKIEDTLKKKGAVIQGKSIGFFVKGTKGPLVDGETERAVIWAKGIAGIK